MSIRESRFYQAANYFLYLLKLLLSRLLKSLWLFFPGILFLVLVIWCFWTLGQGKDIIVAFTENQKAKIFFFIAIGFWIYVSWYSSRIVSYIKKSKQNELIEKILVDHPGEAEKKIRNARLFELPAGWLEIFPRLIGFACLLSIELAVLQSPALGEKAISTGNAGWIFFSGLIISLVIDNKVHQFADKSRILARIIFYILLGIFVVAAVLTSLIQKGSITLLLWIILILHIVFIFYINLRRKKVEEDKNKALPSKPIFLIRWMYKVMDFLCVPRGELGYFKWFNIVSVLGLFIYLWTINSIETSWKLGPFPFVLIAFAVLSGFGNIITSVSVKSKINFHFIIFLVALFFGSSETHYVRTKPFDNPADHNIYSQRQGIQDYFKNWINIRAAEIDSTDTYPVYFVLANGGASRSGYWTASVLGKLEDTTSRTKDPFSRHVFCLSGTSGGGVGVATFFSLLYERKKLAPSTEVSYLRSAKEFLKGDFLTHTLAHMLGPDYFKYIFHISGGSDRAGALEETIEQGALACNDSLKVPMYEFFSKMIALKDKPYDLPVLCINTTRMQDGNPGVVTNIQLDPKIFNNRVDFCDILNDTLDIRLSTASIMGARFPYVSPAGRIDQSLVSKRTNKEDSLLIHYFVDGGYFDNSGAGVVQEMMRAMINYTDTTTDIKLKERAGKLKFTVLHITNSPVGNPIIENVSPFKNDLMSPILTIVGAYDMQTTVNDSRLINFLGDINQRHVGKGAEYYPIHLYKNIYERMSAAKNGIIPKEMPYAMNWFISDTTLKRMDNRLANQPKLNELIQRIVH